MLRAAAKRPALKRVNPSMRELELVCTAALTGRTAGDPVMGGLETCDGRPFSRDRTSQGVDAGAVLSGKEVAEILCGRRIKLE